ncbi:ATP phosphoribosyltransferase [Humisphaera borealis]|uniref:ATP phosphoribosyltransferase n=1 Tax=Humisphaera borealis TaxID=2807512 RepID=A0A7M2WZF4_9BACT|nr:ATP phosphoribosyltransferase [Humisphaera borealis]QOV90819.1 ATP phosphoribosyltransferase [Humisphaera borealis]
MTDRLPESTLRLGLPSGSLQNATVDLFGRAGYRVSIADRSVFPRIDDPKMSAVLFRAQEISRYVCDNIVDCGLTGYDWIVENGNEKDVVEICELEYSRASVNPVKWVLAVPDESVVRTPEELNGAIIATELVNVTRKYFEQKGIKVTVEFSWGTTEIKARLLDAIVDCTETGSSLRANNLRIVDTLLTSTTRFVANKKAWETPWKREKMENIAMLLRGAIDARAKVGLKMNVPEASLAEVLRLLPAEKSPTVSRLADQAWVAVEVILEEKQERELIPPLKRAGATGLITYPLNKVIA